MAYNQDERDIFKGLADKRLKFKTGPSDLSKSVASEPWSDLIFENRYAAKAKAYWSSNTDVTLGLSCAKYCLAVYLGDLEQVKAENLEEAWKILCSAVSVESEDLYPRGTSGPNAPTTKEIGVLNSYLFGKSATVTYEQVSFSVTEVNAWVEDWKAKSADSNSKQLAINMIAYMMETCFRMSQKEPESVCKHIATRSRDTFNSVTSASLTLHFPPPHVKFLNYFRSIYAAQQQRSKDRMAALVWAMKNHATSDLAKGWLSASCMLSLSGSGLGLIIWYRKVCQTLEVLEDEAAEAFLVAPMAKGLLRLYKWGVETQSTELTWLWARILDQKVLTDYSVARNVKFCLVCALIVFNLEVEKVKEIAQFTGHLGAIDDLVGVAYGIKTTLVGTTENSFAMGKGIEVRALAMEYNSRKTKGNRVQAPPKKAGSESDDDDRITG